ncbi:hypothetical protein JB92DRAFT_2904156 [Gautieria morchelliformis]|nr:hypothetical protein JB92DRAFT_2904156 [Gautieria morchelliformis]
MFRVWCHELSFLSVLVISVVALHRPRAFILSITLLMRTVVQYCGSEPSTTSGHCLLNTSPQPSPGTSVARRELSRALHNL